MFHHRYVLWSIHPYPVNPFPIFEMHNYVLGQPSVSNAMFVPMHLSSANVKHVSKNQPPEHKLEVDYDQVKPKDLIGKGIKHAFQHPMKV